MSRRAPQDSDARRHAVESPASVLVQAPAGSGKTTLLTQRYLKLLAKVDRPERILALTFTRKAADEMRQRVIGALGLAALPVDSHGGNVDTWTLAVAAREHLHSLAIDVEQHPSRLRIETIDSFNAWLAAQLPIASGAGGRLNLLDDPWPSYDEAARRALEHAGADPFGTAVERTLAVGDQRWRRLAEMIAEMLGGRDRWLPLLAGPLAATATLDARQLERVRAHFDEDLSLLVTRTIKDAAGILGPELVSSLQPMVQSAARRLGSERPELAVWLHRTGPLLSDASDIERWRAFAGLLLTKDGKKVLSRVNRRHGFPPQCAELPRMLDLLAELADLPGAARALAGVRSLPDSR